MTARRLGRWGVGVLTLACLAWLPALTASADEEALREGNRLFRRGDLERALATYRAGYDDPDPVLAYNLGTTAHHLGRLPEAVLWYRRAAELSGDGDLWVAQNLDAARNTLGAARLDPRPPWSVLEVHRSKLTWLAAALAWASLILLLLHRRGRGRGWRYAADGFGIAALLLLAVAAATAWLAPVPAVLLEPCPAAEPRLDAGSEVWGRPDAEGGFRIELGDGERVTCSRDAVGEIRSRERFLLR